MRVRCVKGTAKWGGLERPSFEVEAALFSGILYAPQDGPPSAPSRALPAGSDPSLPTSAWAKDPNRSLGPAGTALSVLCTPWKLIPSRIQARPLGFKVDRTGQQESWLLVHHFHQRCSLVSIHHPPQTGRLRVSYLPHSSLDTPGPIPSLRTQVTGNFLLLPSSTP